MVGNLSAVKPQSLQNGSCIANLLDANRAFTLYFLLTAQLHPMHSYPPSTHLSFPRRLVVLLLEEVTLDLGVFQLLEVSVCKMVSLGSVTVFYISNRCMFLDCGVCSNSSAVRI